MSDIDYSDTYNDYWKNKGRWGEHSFDNPETIIRRILATCAVGKLLDIGCGMGGLVKNLLRKGVDAYGVDVASIVIDEANRTAPGRFFRGSALELPFADNYFDTVISTDFLEHLAEADVTKAISEIYRVTRYHVFIILATTPDRDKQWHLTMHERDWWENKFYAAGFRKHPLFMNLVAYEDLEHEGWQVQLLFEKITEPVAKRYPLATLTDERDLHTDMLRETGRRSDAHIIRYILASQFIREGDVILDAACGLGYGSRILGAIDRSAKVIGIDNSKFAIEYAISNYVDNLDKISFVRADLENLTFLADDSIDIVVSFETMEHISNPLRFLAEVKRVLKPSGRLIVSVPNNWVDNSGHDPNPHHLHVYDWNRVYTEMKQYFLVEAAYSQIAGGGMVLTDQPRSLRRVAIAIESSVSAEWWLMVGMKDPIAGKEIPYVETSFPKYAQNRKMNVIAFKRDYENPWIVKGMVSIGMRSTNDQLLELMATRVLSSTRPGSADAGAAICVRSYRMLENKTNLTVQEAKVQIAAIDNYVKVAGTNPNCIRWVISNLFVKGLIFLAIGNRAEARNTFLECASIDPMQFSPLLATKTVNALFLAGVIYLHDENMERASECWQRGLQEARRVLSGDWTNIWGSAQKPLYFAIPEVTQVLDLATNCAYGLVFLSKGHLSFHYGLPFDRNLSTRLNLLENDLMMKDKTIVVKDETIAKQGAMIIENNRIIEILVTEKNKIIAEQERQVAEKNRIIAERAELIAKKDGVIAEKDALIKEKDLAIYDKERNRQIMVNSISWRITAPLRYLHGIVYPKINALRTMFEPHELKEDKLCFEAHRVKILNPVQASRPRIVHALANFMTGGSSRLVVDLIEHLGHQYEQEVITSHSPNPPCYTGLVLHELKSQKRIADYLHEFQPDVVHVHYWGECDKEWYAQVFSAASKYGCKIIENINTPVEPFFSEHVDSYVYVSDYVLKKYRRNDDKSILIYPGSNFNIFKRRDDIMKIPDNCIGMVYRLEPDKLNNQSIDVFIKVAQLRPETKVLIVGGGSFLETYRNAAITSGVVNSFTFAGYVSYEELPKLYEQMSIFVAPVWKESFGQVSPFAMNMGIPVVGYDIGALSEIIGDKSLLAPPGDSDRLAEVIIDLLGNREKRLSIGRANRNRAQALFSDEVMVKKYKQLYENLIKGQT
jgi:ubiquinone/menaquinone biosynthesis C-methylase UbiE/glycosyltransferase involved in cell wall biosynthesis